MKKLLSLALALLMHLSLHEGPVSEISYNRLSPLKYVFFRAID